MANEYNKLHEYRKKAFYTQEELAILSGISHSAVSGIEKGEFAPNVYSAIRICRALGKAVEDVFIVK